MCRPSERERPQDFQISKQHEPMIVEFEETYYWKEKICSNSIIPATFQVRHQDMSDLVCYGVAGEASDY